MSREWKPGDVAALGDGHRALVVEGGRMVYGTGPLVRGRGRMIAATLAAFGGYVAYFGTVGGIDWAAARDAAGAAAGAAARDALQPTVDQLQDSGIDLYARMIQPSDWFPDEVSA